MTSEQHQEVYARELDVHRIVPGSLYTVEGCVTLCRSCHGPQPRRKKGQPDLANGDRHRHPLVSFRPDHGIRHALQRLADQQRRSLSQMAVLLLEEALAAKGLWPPQAGQGDQAPAAD